MADIDMGSILCEQMVSQLNLLYNNFVNLFNNTGQSLYDEMSTYLLSMSEGKTLPDNDKIKNMAQELLLLGSSIETNGFKMGTAHEDGYLLGMGALGISVDENGVVTSLPDSVIDILLGKFDDVIKLNSSETYANFISDYSQLLHLFDNHTFDQMLLLISTISTKCTNQSDYPTILDIQTLLKEFNMDDSGEINLVNIVNNTDLFNDDNALAARQLELGYYYAKNTLLTSIGKDFDSYISTKRIKDSNSYNYLTV